MMTTAIQPFAQKAADASADALGWGLVPVDPTVRSQRAARSIVYRQQMAPKAKGLSFGGGLLIGLGVAAVVFWPR